MVVVGIEGLAELNEWFQDRFPRSASSLLVVGRRRGWTVASDELVCRRGVGGRGGTGDIMPAVPKVKKVEITNDHDAVTRRVARG